MAKRTIKFKYVYHLYGFWIAEAEDVSVGKLTRIGAKRSLKLLLQNKYGKCFKLKRERIKCNGNSIL